jgi:hypothetical protein
MKTLAIIGTAGRKDDATKLAAIPNAFTKMCDTTKSFICARIRAHEGITLISGGAAWADHIAVALFLDSEFLKGFDKRLTLATPCHFQTTGKIGYLDTGEFSFSQNPGGTINYYHRKFSEARKLPGNASLLEIRDALAKGATPLIGAGFHQRNTLVAQQADILLAFTFGDKNVVKNGGTADTVEKFLQTKRHETACHCDLHTFKVYENATTSKRIETDNTTPS